MQWLCANIVGEFYGIAFVARGVRIAGLFEARGIRPAGLFLSRVAEALGPSRYWNFPTVFWFGASDLALQLACAMGAVFSILLVAGVFERTALIVCYALYVSLMRAGQVFLSFQWHILLLETGFLAIFLGFSPAIVWLFRWLLFRLMLLSGAVKLLSGDATWRTMAALKFHYQTQ